MTEQENIEKMREVLESIDRRLLALGSLSQGKPAADISSVMQGIITAIDARLIPAITGQKSMGQPSSTTGVTAPKTPFEQIAADVASIKRHLDIDAAFKSGSPATGRSGETSEDEAKEKEPKGFQAFFKDLWSGLSKAWKGSKPETPAIPKAVPVEAPTFMGMSIKNPALTPPALNAPLATAVPAPVPPSPPGWLSGISNLLASFGKAPKDRQSFGDRLSDAGEKAKNAATNQSDFGSIGDALGGVSKIAGAIPVAGGPIAGVAKLGEVAFKSVDKLQQWTATLHNSNMVFAEFSASMAHVQAKQMVRDIDYSRDRGEARADSADKLAEGMSELRNAMAPMSDGLANLKNNIGASISKTLADMLNTINDLFDFLRSKDKTEGGVEMQIEAAALGIEYWKEKVDPQFR